MCDHNFQKGQDARQKNKPFKTCSKCGLFEWITPQEFYNFEELKLEEKIRKIVKEILNETNLEN